MGSSEKFICHLSLQIKTMMLQEMEDNKSKSFYQRIIRNPQSKIHNRRACRFKEDVGR